MFKNIPSPSPFTTTITIQKVAKYKIPKYVELIEELPKTASGKIQKFLLKEMHKTEGLKSEARNPKLETNFNDQNPKFKT